VSEFSHSTHIQALLLRLQEGDAAAHAELISYPLERLRRLARWMFHRQPDQQALEQTDDVLQKALIRLHRALSEVKPTSVRSFFGLAARQVRWVLQDLARDLAKAKMVMPVGDLVSTTRRQNPLEPLDMESEPSTLEEWAEFHEKVESLPEETREVFDLVWYQGLTQIEAAEVLGISLRNVKRRWLAARLLLRHLLHNECPGIESS